MRLWGSKLSAVSAFPRPEEHLTRQTAHGAIVTLLGVVLASTLFCHELAWYTSAKSYSQMEVDLRRHRDLSINFDITFHAVPCAALSVDIIDASGTADSDVNFAQGARLHKVRLTTAGDRVPGEYETPQSQRLVDQGGSTVVNVDLNAAVRHMSHMEQELAAHEGCRLHGDVTVRRVAGRLHFAVHQQSFVDLLPQMLTGHVLPRMRNMSHTVHRVSFGPSFPGQVNPLDNTVRIEPSTSGGHGYKYYVKIVPTEFTTRLGTLLETSQYSVSEYAVPLLPADSAPAAAPGGRRDPFVDVVYDLSPIVMRIHQSPLSLMHFIVRLCAVVGGALSVTRLADTLVDGAVRALGGHDAARRGCSTGGRGTSYGGGSLPVSSDGGSRLSNGGSSVAARVSTAGDALSLLGGLGASLLRQSVGGRVSGGGSSGGGLLPTHSSSSGGGARLAMSPLTGLAPPPLAGFGSWSELREGFDGANKKR